MMQDWFREAKLGIFLHWGLYAVKGITESWSFFTGALSYDEYMSQAEGFTAENYDPDEWADLFAKAGAKYAVLTAKHHDGFALYDTKFSDLNVVKGTPAGRDLIAPYCDALRRAGLRVGLYYTNTDWSAVDNMCTLLDCTPEEFRELNRQAVNYMMLKDRVNAQDSQTHPTPTPEQLAVWKRFLQYYRDQMKEVLTNFGDVDLLWTDVMMARAGYDWDCDETIRMINEVSPNTVLNSRIVGYGDYDTPEMYIPLRPLDRPWELCTSFNESWGYQPHDHNYKTVRQIVRIFVECISKGGNLLISFGPKADGSIPEEVRTRLLELGEWTHRYAEAIYPTEKGLDPAYFQGGSTLSKDKKTLYLFVYDRPQEQVMLNGIRSRATRITSMVNGQELTSRVIGGAPWLNLPGSLWINLPAEACDPVCTVLKLEYDSEIDAVPLDDRTRSVGGI